jgi:hypothetical protein
MGAYHRQAWVNALLAPASIFGFISAFTYVLDCLKSNKKWALITVKLG